MQRTLCSLAIAACLLAGPVIARAAATTVPAVTDLGSSGAYSGPIAPGDHFWYRFWYPGGKPINVETTIQTGARTDTLDTYKFGVRIFRGETIDALPGAGMNDAGVVQNWTQSGLKTPYWMTELVHYPATSSGWYLLEVFNVTEARDGYSAVRGSYSGHVAPVGTAPRPTPVPTPWQTPVPTRAPVPEPRALVTPVSPVSPAPDDRPAGLATNGACASPAYQSGFKTLHDLLLSAYGSDRMGAPKTCEYADPNGTGDVEQGTANGLAFWRKSTNTPTFTNGSEHWAFAPSGPVYWVGASIDPGESARSLASVVAVSAPAPAPKPPAAAPAFASADVCDRPGLLSRSNEALGYELDAISARLLRGTATAVDLARVNPAIAERIQVQLDLPQAKLDALNAGCT